MEALIPNTPTDEILRVRDELERLELARAAQPWLGRLAGEGQAETTGGQKEPDSKIRER